MTTHISNKCSSLSGTVSVPGDKSISHRALILASQVLGTTTITGLLEGEDVIATANALRSMGVDIAQERGRWIVKGVGVGGLCQPDDVIDCGNSGTSARLLMGLVAPYAFTSFFTGDASLRKRPMKRVTTPLEQMGAVFIGNSRGNTSVSSHTCNPEESPLPPAGGDRGRVSDASANDITPSPNPSRKREGNILDNRRREGDILDSCKRRGELNISLPLAIQGKPNTLPIHYELPVASAQVKSAILLAGLNTAGKTTVVEPTSTRDHTEKMLKYFGFDLEVAGNTICMQGQQAQLYEDREFAVPTDPSSAAFLAVAALITKGSVVTLENVCINPHRIGLYTTLKEMGADIVFKNERDVAGEPVADMAVKHSTLKGVEVPAERAPSMIDEYPILAVAAAFAKGKTTMRGLGELRVKESNRLDAIVSGLTACGAKVEVNGDDIIIYGGSVVKGGATIQTNLDHRICMSFLVMGMATEEAVSIDSAEPINTSFPGFVDMCNMLGANMHGERRARPRNIVIAVDGQAASGKGTLARRLAKHYGLQYLDTGSLYRAVGLKLLDAGHAPEDKAAAIEAAQSISLEDLSSPRLRQEEVGNAASIVSAYPAVRTALLAFQREVAQSEKGAVLDGRDIGTVVCPDADVKFFLTASMEARAKRRHKELSGQGIEVVYQSVYDDLKERDERDSKREIAPMKPADDAVQIDTSTMDANSVLEKAKTVIG